MLWGDGDERMIINDLNDIKETYGLIYADPPWKQSKGNIRKCRPNQGKQLDYPTCDLEEIKSIHIKDFIHRKLEMFDFSWKENLEVNQEKE